MRWEDFFDMYADILNGKITDSPYDNEAYLEYVKLNNSRMKRWLKKTELEETTLNALNGISEKQKWVLINEPWCGDAANIAPILYHMAETSSNIELTIELRDSSDMIDDYLTNGGKSIPKLVVRNANDEDIFVWGPRPQECQNLVMKMKDDTDMTAKEKKAATQMWYNNDKGISVQRELTSLIEAATHKVVA